MTGSGPMLRAYFITYALLLMGVAATVAAAYVPLGRLNALAAVTIACLKAALVVLIFMHVRYAPRLTWIVVASGLVWLGILLTLVQVDYASREWVATREPADGQSPSGLRQFESSRSSQEGERNAR